MSTLDDIRASVEIARAGGPLHYRDPIAGKVAGADREFLLGCLDAAIEQLTSLEATSGSLEQNLARWKASFWEQRKAAANLLAHQQARALELAAERFRYSTALDTIASLECDSDDLADTCGCASCRAHEALASSDELSEIAIRDTELATLRAERERLHRANVNLVAQASSREHERKQLRKRVEDLAHDRDTHRAAHSQLRSELVRKDAETQRLREVLEEVRQTLRMRTEVVPGLGQVVLKADVDLLARVDAALGEEVRDESR